MTQSNITPFPSAEARPTLSVPRPRPEFRPDQARPEQPRKKFALVYRTKVGNDTQGITYGYKYHLLYGLTATPSEKAYQTINESPEAMTLSWEVSSTPVVVEGMEPTSVITIDSTTADEDDLAALELKLFGSPTTGAGETFASMPSPAEVLALFA